MAATARSSSSTGELCDPARVDHDDDRAEWSRKIDRLQSDLRIAEHPFRGDLLDGKDVTGAKPAQMIGHGVTYVPQGRNLIPQLSVWHNLELGGVTSSDQPKVRSRIEEVMEQFPMLRQRQHHKAVALSGGQQKQLEIARSLILDPKLILIDEPSIGLSPNLVHEVFVTLQKLRDNGATVLVVEQNAKAALAISDYGLVLELGQTRMHDRADTLLADRRVGHLFLGGNIGEEAV